MTKKLVIIDLDNTLVNTRPAAKEAYKQAINHLAKAIGREHDNKKLYNHWKKIVQRVLGEKKPQFRRFEYSLGQLMEEQKIDQKHLATCLHTYQKTLLELLESQNGARDLLTWLKDQGHTVIVATGSAKQEAAKKLKKSELFSFIDDIVSADDVDTMKPSQLYYQKAMLLAGAKASNTVVVGDSQLEDIDPAAALGLQALLVPPNKFHLSEIKAELQALWS